MQADGKGLFLNRARLQLLLAAVRDPTLAEPSTRFVNRILALTQEAISAVTLPSRGGSSRSARGHRLRVLAAARYLEHQTHIDPMAVNDKRQHRRGLRRWVERSSSPASRRSPLDLPPGFEPFASTPINAELSPPGLAARAGFRRGPEPNLE